MAIEKVTLVSVEGGIRRVNKTLIKCCESGCFHINPPPDISRSELAVKNMKDNGAFERLIKRTRALADTLGVKLDENDSYDDIEYSVSVDFKKYLDEIDEMQKELTEEKMRLNSELHSQNAIYENLSQLSGLDADLAELMSLKYAKYRFGRLPNGSLKKLSFYSDKVFFFFPFEQEKNYTWCLYIASVTDINDIDFMFNILGFEPTPLPEYLKGSSDEAISKLLEQMESENRRMTEIDAELAKIAQREGGKLSRVYAKLVAIGNSYELRSNVIAFDGRFHFSGYIPESEKKRFSELIGSIDDVTVTYRQASPDEPVPVRLKNNWLFRPFEMFVKMYGMPAANGIDPTPLVAITYMLLYGMMFGDLGQGLCIMVLGIILTKLTKAGLAPIIARIGLSSALFGALYGSVFGNEEIIKPFFHIPQIYEMFGYTEPPEDIFAASTMFLLMALAFGVVLIIAMMIINIIVSLRMKDYESGIFGASGICGFVLYVSLVAGLGCSLALGIKIMTPVYVIGLIVLPAVLMFFKEPLLHAMAKRGLKSVKPAAKTDRSIDTGLKARLEAMNVGRAKEKTSVGMFIIEGVIDLFDVGLTYITNTMSYLRIGGFILSHAGLMLVFSIIANMFEGAGSVIVLIFGNIFVIGFEGFIVGIQVLRLEFYELFSRFFKGGGIPFRPVSIGSKAA
ncbi:MAG: ATPase [Ruminiclostridium sp.]|nr:ATPase [Ruminiclostridium sp.]